jgi:hypothetical protein
LQPLWTLNGLSTDDAAALMNAVAPQLSGHHDAMLALSKGRPGLLHQLCRLPASVIAELGSASHGIAVDPPHGESSVVLLQPVIVNDDTESMENSFAAVAMAEVAEAEEAAAEGEPEPVAAAVVRYRGDVSLDDSESAEDARAFAALRYTFKAAERLREQEEAMELQRRRDRLEVSQERRLAMNAAVHTPAAAMDADARAEAEARQQQREEIKRRLQEHRRTREKALFERPVQPPPGHNSRRNLALVERERATFPRRVDSSVLVEAPPAASAAAVSVSAPPPGPAQLLLADAATAHRVACWAVFPATFDVAAAAAVAGIDASDATLTLEACDAAGVAARCGDDRWCLAAQVPLPQPPTTAVAAFVRHFTAVLCDAAELFDAGAVVSALYVFDCDRDSIEAAMQRVLELAAPGVSVADAALHDAVLSVLRVDCTPLLASRVVPAARLHYWQGVAEVARVARPIGHADVEQAQRLLADAQRESSSVQTGE